MRKKRVPVRGKKAVLEGPTAYICASPAAKAMQFYSEVFDASETVRIVTKDGRVGHAELTLGTSRLLLADEFPEVGFRKPGTDGGVTMYLHLTVSNVDTLAAKAAARGATILREPVDQAHGERQCAFRDPFGHAWLVAHTLTRPRADRSRSKKGKRR